MPRHRTRRHPRHFGPGSKDWLGENFQANQPLHGSEDFGIRH